MFNRVETQISRPPFVVDRSSLVRDTGRQIDWDLLDGRYVHGAVNISVNGNVDIDDDTITVDALAVNVPAGTVLDFGVRPSFVVTLAGNEAIGQTDIGVTALPGAIRSGTILKSGAGEFMQLTADAAAGATSLTVEALEVAWESGDTATVPEQHVFAVTTSDADIGDTSIDIEPADFWINDGDIAVLGTGGSGGFIPAGTCMDLLDSGKIVPSALNTSGVTAYCLLETNADETSRDDAITGYGALCAGFFYANLLPEATGSPKVLNPTWVTELKARGGSWQFDQYSDNT